MTLHSRTPRRGFTLLEVILATSIGLIIMYALYLAIDVSLRFSEAGREVVEHATISRSLAARISSDIAPCVGIPDPSRYRGKNAAATTTPTQGGGGTQPMQGGGNQPMQGA